LNAQWQGATPDGTRCPGLVVVPGTSQSAPAGGFTAITGPELEGCEESARVIEAPPGSITFWNETGVHGNAGAKHTLGTESTATVTLAVALTDPARVLAFVGDLGYCVVTGVLSPSECAAMVDAAKGAVKKSRVGGPGAKFKGPGGCGLWKHWGVSTNENLREYSVHPNVVALWRAVLGTEDICFSPDAIAFVAPIGPNGGHEVDTPSRVTQILCYGVAAQQKAGTGAKKLEYYKRGGSCNHPPCSFSKGGSGRHYSDRGEWVAQVPTFGRNLEVDAQFEALLGP
jgi:hypothetical protein